MKSKTSKLKTVETRRTFIKSTAAATAGIILDNILRKAGNNVN